MPKYCCVCSNSNKKSTSKRFHAFPKNKGRRHEWIKRLNIQKSPSKHQIVCSDHFDENDYFVSNNGYGNKILLKPDSLPKNIVQLGNCKNTSEATTEELVRSDVLDDEVAVVELTTDQLRKVYLNSKEFNKCENEVLMVEVPTDRLPAFLHEHSSNITSHQSVTAKPEVNEIGVQAKPEMNEIGVQAKPEVKQVGVQAERPRKRTSFVSLTDDDLIYFTGLERERFEIVYSMLEKFNPIADGLLWSKRDALVITLYKCKHNLDFKMMDFTFYIDRKLISEVFKEVIDKLYVVLRKIDIWKLSFKDSKSYRCILDCTEFYVVKADNANMHQLTFSTYKHHPTFKLLVSCDEKGAVNFISEAFVGSTSDREIFVKSGLIEKLEKGDAIMADKGFDVSDLLESKGVLLNIPPFLKDKKQLSNFENEKNKILTSPIQNCLWPYANKIIYVCFALVNFYKPLK